jgi:hypothetical protein
MSEEIKLCGCCHDAPVGGYVPRYRVTLDKLCTKCWKKGGQPTTATGTMPTSRRPGKS